MNLTIASDPHVTDAADPFYHEPYAGGRARLAEWVSLANAGGYDRAVVLGDIAHDSEAMAEDAAIILAPLNNPLLVNGNHDVGPDQDFFEYSAAECAARKAFLLTNYGLTSLRRAFDLKFCRVLVVDSCWNGTDEDAAIRVGYLPPADLNWIRDEIAATTKEAVLVFIHHPPQRTNNDWFDAADATAVQAHFDSRPNVFVFSGHQHPAALEARTLGTRSKLWVMPPMAEYDKYVDVVVTRKHGGAVTATVTEKAL